MPLPSDITDLSSTAASNSPAGADAVGNQLDDYLRAIQAILRAESLNKGWERYDHTATWLSATTFSVPTDLTGLYLVGRRLKVTLAGPTTAYSTVTASAFGAGVTTVTVSNDSTALSSPISEVQLGLDVFSLLGSGAKLFNGAKAETQATSDSSEKIATTAFVQAVGAVLGGVVGDARNARMSVATAGVSGTFTADEVIVATSLAGAAYRLGSYSKAINLSITGAGGMDTGTAPVSGFVSLYAIYNPTTATASILACNATTSTASVYGGVNMPAGYTASALIGIWPTDASSFFKAGYLSGRALAIAPVEVLDSDSGNPTTYTSLSLSSAVPTIAKKIFGMIGSGGGANGAHVAISPTNGTVGQQTHMISVTSENFNDWLCSTRFDLPVITAQTMYYKCRAAGQPIRIEVNGYEF